MKAKRQRGVKEEKIKEWGKQWKETMTNWRR